MAWAIRHPPVHWKRGLNELSKDGKVVKKKENVARLKIYKKRASDDDMQSSGPSAKKSKVHNIIVNICCRGLIQLSLLFYRALTGGFKS